MISRGMRNLNPLNLRPSPAKWEGLRPDQTDPGYLQFASMFHGLRAAAVNLLTYFRVHRRRTVRDIISAWAPPEDNNPTSAYMATVAKALNVGIDDPVDLENGDVLRRLMEAMIMVENGSQPFPRVDLETAINAAYASHRKRPDKPGVYQPEPEDGDMPDAAKKPETPPQAPPQKPRDEIVPPTRPALVDQPSPIPTRKVVAGGLAGAVAFIFMALWNRLFPEIPIPAEYATEIASAVVLLVTLITQYFTRNRATDIPPAPTSQSPDPRP